MDEERVFRGIWIPAKVWLDERLSPLEKIILAEIDSLDNTDRGCYATNEHIAQFCQCSPRKVSEAVSRLAKFDYVSVTASGGKSRVLHSRLAESARGVAENAREVAESAIQPRRKCEPTTQNLLQSNIKSNIESNIERNNNTVPDGTVCAGFVKPSVEEVAAYISEKGYSVDAEAFVAFYESNGWRVGRNLMKSWKAALVTWHKKNKEQQKPTRSQSDGWDYIHAVARGEAK